MIKKTVISLAVFSVLGYPGWAQDRGGGYESPSSGQGQQTQQPSQRRDNQRPLFLSGKVILDDGRILVEGTSGELVKKYGGEQVIEIRPGYQKKQELM